MLAVCILFTMLTRNFKYATPESVGIPNRRDDDISEKDIHDERERLMECDETMQLPRDAALIELTPILSKPREHIQSEAYEAIDE